MILDLFEKQYNVQNYHCVHFVIEAAQKLLNQDYSQSFIGLTASLSEAVQTSRHTVIRNRRLKEPIHGCIVLMTSLTGSNHVGLFFNNKILHLNDTGVQYITIRAMRSQVLRFRYYEPITNL